MRGSASSYPVDPLDQQEQQREGADADYHCDDVHGRHYGREDITDP
jgi:hypothetical protein